MVGSCLTIRDRIGVPTQLLIVLDEMGVVNETTMKVRKRKPQQKTKRAERLTDKFVFRLYVTGRTASSISAIANLKEICHKSLEDKCKITVIDILKKPKLAIGDQVIATPTLVKTFPLPMRIMIGDLSNTDRVLKGLHVGAGASV